MTLVLTTNKAQLVLMLLFAHKLRSCWCLHTNLTLPDYKIFLFFSPPPPQEFSGGDASVPRSSALKGLTPVNFNLLLAFSDVRVTLHSLRVNCTVCISFLSTPSYKLFITSLSSSLCIVLKGK